MPSDEMRVLLREMDTLDILSATVFKVNNHVKPVCVITLGKRSSKGSKSLLLV